MSSKQSTPLYKEIVWIHVASGKRYRIAEFQLRERDLHPMVSYRAMYDETLPAFQRECEEFFDGRFMPETTTDAPYTAGGKPDSDKKSSEPNWQGQLIPKIALDVDDRSLVQDDYVQLYMATPEERAKWGATPRRKVIEVLSDKTVRLEHLDEESQKTVWNSQKLRYDGSRPDAGD